MRKGYQRAAVLGLLPALLLPGGCTGGNGADYVTVTPDVGPVEYRVEDTGTVTYGESYTIVPAVAGTVESCSIQEGDTVTAGQILYVLNSDGLEDQITQAVLALDSAQAGVAQVQTSVQQAQAAVDQAQTALEQAQAACKDLTVSAYASGTVTAVNVHVGDMVSAGTPVAQIEDSVTLKLVVTFTQEDAAAIGPGSAAVISFPGMAGTLPGTVERVYDMPVALSGSRTGKQVELSVQNPGTLAVGSTAMASVGGVMCMEGGTLSSSTQQAIYAAQSGQVLTLSIQEGGWVTQGQTVMTLKNNSLTNGVENARLQLESARVQLQSAQQQVESAQIQVHTAQETVDQLTRQREDYTITAPVDGIILSRTVKQGDLAAVGSPMAVLAQPQALCVHASIDEQYIDRVGTEQAVYMVFTTDTGEERTYTGLVRRVEDTGLTAGGVTDYTVEIALDSTDGLRDGMNVSVSILTARKESCLRLPVKAVDGDSVRVLRDGKEELVPVETGLWGSTYVELLSGVSQEDVVIVP